MKYIAAYIMLINVIGIIVMYKDKQSAIKHQWRTKESTLFIIALLFGSLGILLGMRLFRHKTKHWKFVVFIPLILVLQIIILYYASFL